MKQTSPRLLKVCSVALLALLFSFEKTKAQTPANDDPCNAINISTATGLVPGFTGLYAIDQGASVFSFANNVPYTTPPGGPNLVFYSGSNKYATNMGVSEPVPPCGVSTASPKTVWYKFTAPTVSTIGITIRSSYTTTSFSNIIAAYTISNNPCSNAPVFTNIGCSTLGSLSLSAAVIAANAGQTIYLQLIGGNISTPSNFMLSAQAMAPNISLSAPTSSSITVNIPTINGINYKTLYWKGSTAVGYSSVNLQPTISTYTLTGLKSGENYQVCVKYVSNTQSYYSGTSMLSTTLSCSSTIASSPLISPISGWCSKINVTWAAHQMASSSYPYTIYWGQVGSMVYQSLACNSNSATISGMQLSGAYQVWYRVNCSGGGSILSPVLAFSTCSNGLRTNNSSATIDTTTSDYEINGVLFTNSDIRDVVNYADNTVSDGDVHELNLNEIKPATATVAVDNTATPGSLELFPNPTFDLVQLNYQLPDNSASILTIRLLDIKGKLIKETTTSVFSSSGSFILDVKDVSNGIYLVNISSETFTATKRLVIAK